MIFSNLLYIFQSEHYNRMRFLKFVYSNILSWNSFSDRGKIEWTLRAKILMFLSVFLFVIDFLFLSILDISFNFFIDELIFLVLEILFFPVYLIIADFFLAPFLNWEKQKIFAQAEKILEKYKNPSASLGNQKRLQVIGITGSFGKTSLKNILTKILETEFSIITIPGNINTDLGVANYIINHKKELENADFLIVEMGAFKIGEIQSICDVVHPEYSFLTAIAPVHLERFGSIENIIKAKFELLKNTSRKCYINFKNGNIKKFLNIYSEKAPVYYHKNNCSEISKITFLPEFSGIEFQYKNKTFQTKLISEYIFEFFEMIFPFAQHLKISPENIQKGIANIDYTPHRLEVIKNKNTGITVIDDSYNGNFSGFVAGLKTLYRATGRKIVLTPGIVELGKISKKVHQDLAKIYIEKLDLLLLIKNKNTQIIQKFLDTYNANYPEKRLEYKMYLDVHKAHADLPNVLKKGDTILFQNDLSDNY